MGKSVALECGTFVVFELSVDPSLKVIEEIAVRSNGCGFMIAAAEVLANSFRGRKLTELHALTDEPTALLIESLRSIPDGRRHCCDTVITAFKDAFADFRHRQVEEFSGEKALVCTCFGVTEETIEKAVVRHSATSVEEVGLLCRAGTGCGSCQMMIQEILDSAP